MIIANWRRIHLRQQSPKSDKSNSKWGSTSDSPPELHSRWGYTSARIPWFSFLPPLTLRCNQNNIPYYSAPIRNCPNYSSESQQSRAYSKPRHPDNIFATGGNIVRRVSYLLFVNSATPLFEHALRRWGWRYWWNRWWCRGGWWRVSSTSELALILMGWDSADRIMKPTPNRYRANRLGRVSKGYPDMAFTNA